MLYVKQPGNRDFLIGETTMKLENIEILKELDVKKGRIEKLIRQARPYDFYVGYSRSFGTRYADFMPEQVWMVASETAKNLLTPQLQQVISEIEALD